MLNIRVGWLQRARLWKLILSQNVEGSWEATSTTAFSLEARSLHEMHELPTTWATRGQDFVRGFMEALGEDQMLDVHEVAEAIAAARESKAGTKLHAEDEIDDVADEEQRSHTVFDCPLTNSGAAITATLPRVLRALRDEQSGVMVERVWATMCVIAFLERQSVMWLWGDGDGYYFEGEERTIVDAGREWIERHTAEQPALARVIRGPELWKQAGHTVHLWHRASEARVSELRASKAIRAQMGLSHAHRTLVSIMRALLTQHKTFSTVLSEPLEGLQRWQSAYAAAGERACDRLFCDLRAAGFAHTQSSSS